MRISEVADITGLSISNIRFYEKKGLLSPARKSDSRYRDYSKEDILRLKTILLYRKMDLSIDTIYLLLNQDITLEDSLKRQKEELLNQIEMLEGSLSLCQKILASPDLPNIDIDYYLNYVSAKEAKGEKFAMLHELLDNWSEYTHLDTFCADPLVGHFFSHPWVKRGIAAVWLLVLSSLPVVEIYEKLINDGSVSVQFFIYWLVFSFITTVPFFAAFIRKKHKPKEREGL